jgi:fatty-acyl-CoA synthase
LSSVRYVDFRTPVAHHPTVTSEWYEPGHAYGNTEMFTINTCYPANTPAEIHGESSGVPLPGNTVKIVDPLSGEIVARGERGEICVKGPLEAYPGVKAVKTVGVPHDTLGEVVVACIVAQDGASLDAEEIRGFLRQRLASYKVPRHVLFLDAEALSVTGTGKLKAAELKALATEKLQV